ncbi:hypothetical protein [Streptomyces sp. NPDC093544]|jgi:hypothetical protein|uniref:hypothetical protein n=1 Tax=Streptomyces sp. NPDC093544 TaxID=3155200 RepID=UPI0034181B06
MSLSHSRSRTLAAVGFLAATGLFLTACGPDGSSADSGVSAPSGAASATDASAKNREDGTVTGTLTYLAAGKLEVGGRPFFVADDTEIVGGEICGDPETQAAETCTADELDEAAKTGNVTAQVSIKEGIATKVVGTGGDDGATDGGAGATEEPAGQDDTEEAGTDNRVDGTVTGTLTYLAPGKLEVGGRPFFVADDTEIVGGDICGDPETQAAEVCTPDDLDGAAQGGNLTVEVTIKEGVAEQVTQV